MLTQYSWSFISAGSAWIWIQGCLNPWMRNPWILRVNSNTSLFIRDLAIHGGWGRCSWNQSPADKKGRSYDFKLFVMTPRYAFHPALFQFHLTSLRPGRGGQIATRLKISRMREFPSSFKHSEKGVSCSELFPYFPL